MFAPNTGGLNPRRRTGLRSHSRLNSTGVQSPDDQALVESPIPPPSQNTAASSKPNAMLGVKNNNNTYHKRSITPLARVNPLQAMAVAEEQNMALEEGLKQAAQMSGGLSVLSRDEFQAVTSYSRIPTDVDQMLSSSDPNIDAFGGQLDHSSGFACVWSRYVCYVWNYARRTSTLPTCYSFPCPVSTAESILVNTLSPLPLAAFISHNSTTTGATRREPGLLLIAPTGELRAWDSLSLALSGVDKYATVQVQLREGELIRRLQPLNSCPGSFVLATSHTRLFRVLVSPGATGRPTVISSIMSRTNTWGTKLGTLIRWGQAYDPKAGIVALAVSPTLDGDMSVGGGEAWALEATGALQRWKIDFGGGGERFLWEKELIPIILETLMPTSEADAMSIATSIDFSLQDLKVTSTRDLAVLVSYIHPAIASDVPSSIKPRSFAIIILDVLSNASLPSVSHIVRVQHREYPDPRLEAEPSLILPHGGPSAFICFPERLVALSLNSGTDFEEVTSLKANHNNRVLGTGAAPLVLRSSQDNLEKPPIIKLLTVASGILEVELNPAELERPISQSTEEQLARHILKLKTKLDQAVFFGDKPENPLAFSLEGPLKGDLATAAEQTSKEIMLSSAAHLPAIVDLRAQLSDRLTRLQLLIRFISTSGMLNKLSKTSKRQLMSDSEILSATHALWLHHNYKINVLSQAHRPQQTFLGNAITVYMNTIGQAGHEDLIRTFFRTHASSLIHILECSQIQVKSILRKTSHALHKHSVTILEANEVLLAVYNAAVTLRNAHNKTYDLQDDTSTEPWTSSLELLNILQFHYEVTLDILQQRTREFGPSVDQERPRFGAESATVFMNDDEEDMEGCSEKNKNLQQALKDQLVELAEKSLHMMNERISFLTTVLGDNSTDTKALTERYLRLRPQLISGLVKVGRHSRAIGLAEDQRDFRTLVQLCYTSGASGTERRVQGYIDRYQEEFAFQLYQWYVEQGRFLDLLTQDARYADLVTSFLDNTDYGKFSWIHDLAIDRFSHAANVLVAEGINERDLADQKLMLSLSKLCQVAQISVEDLQSEQTLRAIEAVDDRLDIVDAQMRLVDLCNSIVNSQPQYALQSTDGQATILRNHFAPNLKDRPAFGQLFEKFVRQTLTGQALKFEDLIDMYSLKANLDDQVEDFVIAIDALARAKDLVPGRVQLALQSVWRRIYIHEDWLGLKKTGTLSDEDLMACLKSTALYHVLSNLLGAKGTQRPSIQILTPNESYFDPSKSLNDDLSIRYPDHSTNELEKLMEDYQYENIKLKESIEKGNLWNYYNEIKRLIQEVDDSEEDEEIGDVTMMSQ